MNIKKLDYQYALKTVKDSSPGSDEITYSMIKQMHPSMQEAIIQLYNKILTQRQIPRQLENSNSHSDKKE